MNSSVFKMTLMALLVCNALVMSVVGGLYAYNNFLANPEPVHAQDAGANAARDWTVSSVRVGGDQDFLVVMKKAPNPYDNNADNLQMAVYEIDQSKGTLKLMSARTTDYDFRIFDLNNDKKMDPIDAKEFAEKYAEGLKKRKDREK